MSNNQLTGDFVTDHPWITFGAFILGLGAVKAVDNISAKGRYEIEEIEKRKQVLREKLMSEFPWEDDIFAYSFIEFIGLGKCIDTVEDAVNIWNKRNKGFWDSWRTISDQLSPDEQLSKLLEFWKDSSKYKNLRHASWSLYLKKIEDTLILRGWK